jgi:hypothetical protein
LAKKSINFGANMTETTKSYYLSYSGVRLPLKLTSPIEAGELENRNTYIVAHHDSQGRLVELVRMVYGEEELRHLYQYHDNDHLKQAEITMGGETRVLDFDEEGKPA